MDGRQQLVFSHEQDGARKPYFDKLFDNMSFWATDNVGTKGESWVLRIYLAEGLMVRGDKIFDFSDPRIAYFRLVDENHIYTTSEAHPFTIAIDEMVVSDSTVKGNFSGTLSTLNGETLSVHHGSFWVPYEIK